MLGLEPMPVRTALAAHITGGFERDTYRVEKIVFQSMPGLYVTGNLYLPKRITARLPAVLYLCGHSPGPIGAKVAYQHHGIWLARHGYVAFLIDTVEFGEIPGIHHGTHDLEMWHWLSLGFTPAGPEVWNAIRALDYLETRPEVDSQRIAVTGISGGGAMTWYTAAVDDRVRVASPVCSTWSVEHHTALNAVHENCDCIYFVNTFLADLPSVGALIAPRPLKILNAMRDPSFPAPGYHGVFQRTHAIYELYGAGDRIQEYEHDAPHSDILPFRKYADEWINRWLKDDPVPFEEGEIRPEDPALLRVLDRIPAGAVNERIHRSFIGTARLKNWKDLAGWKRRRAALLGQLKERTFRAFPRTKAPFSVWKQVDRGWPSRYADTFRVQFNTEEGVRVNGQLFVPRGAGLTRSALIYLKGARDVVYPVDYDLILPALGKCLVLVLEPRGVDYPVTNYEMATIKRTAALIGATLESMQIWDLLRAVDFLVDDQKFDLNTLAIYGRKEMGALGLYAAALDDRISRVILDDPPASHWQAPALLNVLRLTDLPEAAGLVAPRPIAWLTPIPAAYRYTTSIYALYGKKENMLERGALGQALP